MSEVQATRATGAISGSTRPAGNGTKPEAKFTK